MPDAPPAPSTPQQRSVRTPVTLAILCGGAYLAVMVLLWAVLRSEAARASEWVPFIGRFHFLLLHLPIGFLAVALFLEVAGWFIAPLRPAGAAVTPVLWLTFFGGVGATVCGFLLARTGGYGEELLSDHQWSGIGLVALTLGTILAKTLFDRSGSANLGLLYRALLFASGGLLTAAAHHGGSLTHGEDFLTKHTPPLLQKVMGSGEVEAPEEAAKGFQEMVVYSDIIEPVMEAKCWSCHNENKVKGDFRMDSFEHLMAGGETGNDSIVPEDPEGSELYYRLVTDDEDELMPPEGKDPLTEYEIEVVRWWIEKGAAETATVADLAPGDGARAVLEAVLAGGQKSG